MVQIKVSAFENIGALTELTAAPTQTSTIGPILTPTSEGYMRVMFSVMSVCQQGNPAVWGGSPYPAMYRSNPNLGWIAEGCPVLTSVGSGGGGGEHAQSPDRLANIWMACLPLEDILVYYKQILASPSNFDILVLLKFKKRGISGPTKRIGVLQKFFKKF